MTNTCVHALCAYLATYVVFVSLFLLQKLTVLVGDPINLSGVSDTTTHKNAVS